jgi:UTP--glucose-1-phosphate uridylyltransferase
MAAQAAHGAAAALAMERVSAQDVSSYGIGAMSRRGEQLILCDIVEKPPLSEAPSTLAVAGRYILHNDILKLLADQEPGLNGEVQLTDALRRAIANGSEIVAELLQEGEERYDLGSFEGLRRATNALARRPAAG